MYLITLKRVGGIAGINKMIEFNTGEWCEMHQNDIKRRIEESGFFSPGVQSMEPPRGFDLIYNTLTIEDTNTGMKKTVKNNEKLNKLICYLITFKN